MTCIGNSGPLHPGMDALVDRGFTPAGPSHTPEGELGFRRGRPLLWLGDNVTTDHIALAGAIPADSAAGNYLRERGTRPRDLNQYSTRRSNHEVMLRGAFTDRALINRLLPERQADGGAQALLGVRAVVAENLILAALASLTRFKVVERLELGSRSRDHVGQRSHS